MSVHRLYVRLVSRVPVFNGYDRMIDAGTAFEASGQRAAGLIATGAAELIDVDDDDAIAAVVMYADDPEIRKCIDRHALMAIADAWGRGLRPD